ncbi:MAG: peptide chain release factor N(5)-glutamine methyltransferase [Ignavibacteriae bacterium]|nr:MAG: peptide chain release factor N(5)-glutamine methyltransferase [Ignavibacteriota bacterium]
MLTVLESLNLSADYLRKHDIESPRINAELLLASILNCKRLDLYLAFDKPLSKDELGKYRNFIKRRGKFEPLQYITGSVEFYGIEIKVNPSVLIPRPETEILIDAVIEQVKTKEEITILDIGCGSGNIAIALAANLSNCKVFGTDISKDALKISMENAEVNGVKNKTEFHQKNILSDDFSDLPIMDIIVSNPPYVSEEKFDTLQNEIKYFEPNFAVTDFSDGYKFYNAISKKAKLLLKPGGKIFFELSENQHIKVKEIMDANGIKDIKINKDYLNIERVIYGVLS